MESPDTNSSAIIKLHVLENEYNLVMKQYEQAHLNYISSLQSQGVLTDSSEQCKNWADETPSQCTANPNYMLKMCKKSCQKYLTDQKKYVELNGRVFWGTAGLKEGNVVSINECKALCSSDPLCTGATYNSAKAYCWTRSGKGDVATGLDTDIALLTDITQNTNMMQQLNDKLTELNRKISNALSEIVPEAQEQANKKNAQQMQLQQIYDQLLTDRKNIDMMINEYRLINEEYTDNSVYVEQTNSAYILWIIFAVVIVFFTLNLQFFPNVRSNPVRFIFWYVILVLLTIVTTHLNSAPGFLLWGLIIVMISFIQMKILPSP